MFLSTGIRDSWRTIREFDGYYLAHARRPKATYSPGAGRSAESAAADGSIPDHGNSACSYHSDFFRNRRLARSSFSHYTAMDSGLHDRRLDREPDLFYRDCYQSSKKFGFQVEKRNEIEVKSIWSA